MDPIKVIYVLGYGHSGSTILTVLLGHHAQAFGTGELTRLVRAWNEERYCSCGETVPQCATWTKVIEHWRDHSSVDPLEVYPALQRECERSVGVWPARGARKNFDQYSELTRNLMVAMAETTGQRVIVDSSKLTSRSIALANVPGIDLNVVHLVRDGRGVAWSMRRPLKPAEAAPGPGKSGPVEDTMRPASRTSLAWTLNNLVSEAVCRRVRADGTIRVRYEDLVNDVGATLQRIGKVVGLDYADVIRQVEGGEPFEPGHVVAGNRLRMKGPIRLKMDTEWQSKMPNGQRKIASLICGPLLRRYGYF
ncbi:MAG: sulfotransferase [Geminicoccales bacterium]